MNDKIKLIWSISCDMALRKVLGPYGDQRAKKNPMYLFEKKREYKRNWHMFCYLAEQLLLDINQGENMWTLDTPSINLSYFKITPELSLTPFNLGTLIKKKSRKLNANYKWSVLGSLAKHKDTDWFPIYSIKKRKNKFPMHSHD